jgi:hypothetical protein
LQEHIDDTRAYYRNLARMLKPGGIALNLHPVLFSLPFVANRVLPHSMTQPFLYFLKRDRTPDHSPKFPAYYDHCRISPAVRERLRSEGFSEVHQRPFYGHGYYKGLWPAHKLQRGYAYLLWKAGATPLATFSYTLAVK